MTDTIKQDLPIEGVLEILVAVTKEFQTKLPNVPLPNLVERVVEPVAYMLFQSIMDQIDPNWVQDNIQTIQVAPESTFVPGPNTLQ